MGTTNTIETTNLQVKDKLITLNRGGAAISAGGAGIEFFENVTDPVDSITNITGWIKLSDNRSSYNVKMPGDSAIYTMALKDTAGNISGNATSASTLALTASTTGTSYFIPFFNNASSSLNMTAYIGSGLKYDRISNKLTCDTFSGYLSGTAFAATNISVTNLVETSTTKGPYPLLFVTESPTVLTNMSVSKNNRLTYNAYTNTLTCNLDGTASNATTVYTVNYTTAQYGDSNDWRIGFVSNSDSTESGYRTMYSSKSGLKYNPNKDTLTCGTFSGTATSAGSVSMGNDDISTTARYIPFVTGFAATNYTPSVTSKLKYTPQTDTLTCANFTGNASTATTAALAREVLLWDSAEGKNGNYGSFRGYAYVEADANSIVVRTGNGDINVHGIYTDYVQSVNRRVSTWNSFLSVGMFTASYPLHVSSTGGTIPGQSDMDVLTNNGVGPYNNASHGDIQIYTSGNIAANKLFAFSDERIKKNIQDINDYSALEILRKIQPKIYEYKDRKKGESPVWGFIAQQIREVLPYSTKLLINNIPNIMNLAMVINKNILILTDINDNTPSFITELKQQSETNPIKIKIITNSKKTPELTVTVKQIIDEKTIEIIELLEDEDMDKVFIYGQEVNDFHSLDKHSIYTVSVAALQEVDRSVEILKKENADLKIQVSDLKIQVSDLTTRLEKLEKIINNL